MTHRVSKLKIQTKLHDRLYSLLKQNQNDHPAKTKASYFYLSKNQTDRTNL